MLCACRIIRLTLRHQLPSMWAFRRATQGTVYFCVVWLLASACHTMQQSTGLDPSTSFNTAFNQNVSPPSPHFTLWELSGRERHH